MLFLIFIFEKMSNNCRTFYNSVIIQHFVCLYFQLLTIRHKNSAMYNTFDEFWLVIVILIKIWLLFQITTYELFESKFHMILVTYKNHNQIRSSITVLQYVGDWDLKALNWTVRKWQVWIVFPFTDWFERYVCIFASSQCENVWWMGNVLEFAKFSSSLVEDGKWWTKTSVSSESCFKLMRSTVDQIEIRTRFALDNSKTKEIKYPDAGDPVSCITKLSSIYLFFTRHSA